MGFGGDFVILSGDLEELYSWLNVCSWWKYCSAFHSLGFGQKPNLRILSGIWSGIWPKILIPNLRILSGGNMQWPQWATVSWPSHSIHTLHSEDMPGKWSTENEAESAKKLVSGFAWILKHANPETFCTQHIEPQWATVSWPSHSIHTLHSEDMPGKWSTENEAESAKKLVSGFAWILKHANPETFCTQHIEPQWATVSWPSHSSHTLNTSLNTCLEKEALKMKVQKLVSGFAWT